MTAKSSPPGDVFRANVLEYLAAELEGSAKKDDLIAKVEGLLQLDEAGAEISGQPMPTKKIQTENTIDVET